MAQIKRNGLAFSVKPEVAIPPFSTEYVQRIG